MPRSTQAASWCSCNASPTTPGFEHSQVVPKANRVTLQMERGPAQCLSRPIEDISTSLSFYLKTKQIESLLSDFDVGFVQVYTRSRRFRNHGHSSHCYEDSPFRCI